MGCRWLAYQLRFDFAVPPSSQELVLPAMAVGAVHADHLSGRLSPIFRCDPLLQPAGRESPDAGDGQQRVVPLACSATFRASFYSPPRGVIIVDSMLWTLGHWARSGSATDCLHERHWSTCDRAPGPLQHVAIVGAGDVGSSLVLELNHRPGLGLKPVAFLDDDSGSGIPICTACRWLARPNH